LNDNILIILQMNKHMTCKALPQIFGMSVSNRRHDKDRMQSMALAFVSWVI